MYLQNKEKEKIKKLAAQYSSNKEKWHFHILAPDCQLNDVDAYALILENTTSGRTHVIHSKGPYMDIGKILVKLLHGDDIVQKNSKGNNSPLSPQVQKILARAKDLNEKGIFWHHHMLFPDCMFNKNKPKWTIMFEDMEHNEVIESISSDEPKGDLKHIEGLFYAQKK